MSALPPTPASTSTTLHWQQLPHAPAPGTVLGHSDTLEDGQVRMHTLFANPDANPPQPFAVLLLKSGARITAFANRCAHFGVPLAAKQQQLIFQPHTSITCNVHYARYRWSDGVCDQGDCVGESLIPIPVAVDGDGTLRIAPGA